LFAAYGALLENRARLASRALGRLLKPARSFALASLERRHAETPGARPPWRLFWQAMPEGLRGRALLISFPGGRFCGGFLERAPAAFSRRPLSPGPSGRNAGRLEAPALLARLCCVAFPGGLFACPCLAVFWNAVSRRPFHAALPRRLFRAELVSGLSGIFQREGRGAAQDAPESPSGALRGACLGKRGKCRLEGASRPWRGCWGVWGLEGGDRAGGGDGPRSGRFGHAAASRCRDCGARCRNLTFLAKMGYNPRYVSPRGL
jgi:hypothetical protein